MVSIVRGEERIIAQGRLLELVTQEVTIEWKTKNFEFARRAPWVRLIVPHQDGSGKILLTREYRSELGRYDYRLSGGKVFDSLAEFHEHMDNSDSMLSYTEAAVMREAREEIGIDVQTMKHLSTSWCGATIVRDLHYYEVSSYVMWEQQLEDGEIITYDFYDIETVKQWCLDGSLDEERSAIVLLRYLSTK